MGYVQKNIYCKQCGRKVGVYDGRSSTNVISICNKCRKRVVYHIDSGKVEMKPILPRQCSSGMTFI